MAWPGGYATNGCLANSDIFKACKIVKHSILSFLSRLNSGSPWQRLIAASGCVASLSVLLLGLAGLIFEWRSVVGSGLVIAGVDVVLRVVAGVFVAGLAFVPFGLLLRASESWHRPIVHAIFGVCVLLAFLIFIAVEWFSPPAGGSSFFLVFFPLYASLAVMALEFGCKLYSRLRK